MGTSHAIPNGNERGREMRVITQEELNKAHEILASYAFHTWVNQLSYDEYQDEVCEALGIDSEIEVLFPDEVRGVA